MGITAKDLAAQLGLSAAAVSLALNDKPGVSEITRKQVLDAAKEQGYDFSKRRPTGKGRGRFAFLIYHKHGAVVAETAFFSELTDGISRACKTCGYDLDIHYLFADDVDASYLRALTASNIDGIILLGTEMRANDLAPFMDLSVPLVVLDTYSESLPLNYVLINNVQGAYIATNHLIAKKRGQPGYLRSSYAIGNFDERADGFYKAIRENGLSSSQSIVHRLAPSIDGAYADMLSLLKSGERTASCYFADNDLIAAGAMRAFKACGYRIPEDIGIVGFDNTSLCELLEPPLTTINVPKQAMGRVAVDRLIALTSTQTTEISKIEISTSLVRRNSI